MTPAQARKLQTNLGLSPDGWLGPATYGALFARMGASTAMASALALGAAVHIPSHGIDGSPLRLAHFLAQVTHETAGLSTMQELGGPPYFARYDGRADLGNTQSGDGARFHGRGALQITGRANYRFYGQRLGIDLEGNPEIAAIPSIGLLIAAEYWTQHGLNADADADDLRGITKAINGGLNGLDDRARLFTKAKGIIL